MWQSFIKRFFDRLTWSVRVDGGRRKVRWDGSGSGNVWRKRRGRENLREVDSWDGPETRETAEDC